MVQYMTRKKRIIRIFACHGVALAVLLFVAFVYKCPYYLLLGIPCPGCGLTRAYLAAFRLDFKSAFAYHPLFPAAAPMLLYAAHREKLRRRLSNKTEIALLCIIAATFTAVYILRLINNAIPA